MKMDENSNIPSEDQLDALREIANIGVGKAARILNEMLESHIELEVPSIVIFKPEETGKSLSDLGDNELACVQLGFYGAFNGSSVLVFPTESAEKLVTIMTGEAPGTGGMEAVMAGTLNETGNIVINCVVGSISNLLSNTVTFSLPNYMEGKLADLLKSNNSNTVEAILLVKTTFEVKDPQIYGEIFLIFELSSLDDLLPAIDNFLMDSHVLM